MSKVAALTLALLGSLCAAPLPRPYTVEHYDVHLVPDFAAKRLAGEVTLRLRSRTERLDAVELDAGDLEVVEARERSAPLFVERRDKLLVIALPKPAYQGDVRTLTIRYTAVPAKGLLFFPDQVYTSFFTNDWMPSNDRPDDRSTLRMIIDAPAKYKVAGSGHFEDGAWTVDTPTPPFLFAFAIGEFAETVTQAGGVKLRVLGKAKVAEATGAALRFFADRTGKPYPGDTYTQVFCHGSVEQEAVGMTLLPDSYGEGLAAKPDDLWLLAHELAHQWYAVAIQCKDWSDFWLNEGMATFLADAFLEKRYGKSRYDKEIENSRGIYEKLVEQGKDRALSFHDWQTTQQASGRLPYHKGAWVLAQLRRQLGDDVFWQGLRSYTSDHWNTAVVSEDFQKSMEKASKKSLDKFFQKWVY